MPRWVFCAGLAGWLAIALILWLTSAPLGHDEAQYAIAARDWLAGSEPRWLYLSKGMNAIALPGVLAGASERSLRLLPLVGGLAFVLATWAVARRTVGPASAAWAVVVLAGSRYVVKWSAELLSDVPAAACLISAVAVIVPEVTRVDGPRWRVLLVAPLLAAAVYLRYGSVVPIAIIVLASVAVGGRVIARRPAPVIATAALFLGLLVPHFLDAVASTGSPLGILLESRSVPQQAYPGAGLVDYVTSNPFKLYGLLTPFVMVAGLVALRGADRRVVLVWIIAVGSIVALGLTTHAKTRYILVGIALLVVLGTSVIHRWVGARPPAVRRALVAGTAILLASSWLVVARSALRQSSNRRASMHATLAAAAALRRDAAGTPCHVLGYHYTQLEWYSGCSSASFSAADAIAQGHRVYAVMDPTPSWDGPTWQPDPTQLPGVPRTLLELPGVVYVICLERPE